MYHCLWTISYGTKHARTKTENVRKTNRHQLRFVHESLKPTVTAFLNTFERSGNAMYFDCLLHVVERSLIIAGKLRSKCCRKIKYFCHNVATSQFRKEKYFLFATFLMKFNFFLKTSVSKV